MTPFTKDPAATLDYSIDWSGYLQDGETLVASFWHVDPDGDGAPVIDSDSMTGPHTAVRVSGGEAGRQIRLVNRVRTDRARTDERSLFLQVIDR